MATLEQAQKVKEQLSQILFTISGFQRIAVGKDTLEEDDYKIFVWSSLPQPESSVIFENEYDGVKVEWEWEMETEKPVKTMEVQHETPSIVDS